MGAARIRAQSKETLPLPIMGMIWLERSGFRSLKIMEMRNKLRQNMLCLKR